MDSITSTRTKRKLKWLTGLRIMRLLPLLILIPALSACSFFKPTLRVAWCSTVPKPNGLVAKYPWDNCPELILNAHRGRGDFAETRPVKIKACYDGRALAFLVRWFDDHESLVGRYWIWDPQRSDYQLQQFPIDQCAILLPISKKADFNPWSGRPAEYDAWQWRAGWSDLSGHADDRRLIVRNHPWGTTADQIKGCLYPLGKRRGMAELQWVDDEGVSGTVPVPKPITFLQNHVTGAEAEDAHGSAADVLAQGVYTPKGVRNIPNRKEAWRYYSDGDDWFVQFYRLMVTDSKAGDDYQIRGRGPHTIALALWDNDSGDNFYLTDPIRMVLDKPGQ